LKEEGSALHEGNMPPGVKKAYNLCAVHENYFELQSILSKNHHNIFFFIKWCMLEDKVWYDSNNPFFFPFSFFFFLTFLIASGFMTSLCYSSLCTSMFFHSLILVHLLFIFRKNKEPKKQYLAKSITNSIPGQLFNIVVSI